MVVSLTLTPEIEFHKCGVLLQQFTDLCCSIVPNVNTCRFDQCIADRYNLFTVFLHKLLRLRSVSVVFVFNISDNAVVPKSPISLSFDLMKTENNRDVTFQNILHVRYL